MSTGALSIPSMNSLFKEVYADQVEKLIPDSAMLTKSVPFVSADKQNGGDYVQPVILSRDHGVTYLGSNSNNLRLNDPIMAIVDRATIRASAMVMRGLMDYPTATRLQGDAVAFAEGSSYLIDSLTDSFSAIIEQTHRYGGSGLGTITTTNGGATNNLGGATGTLTTLDIDVAEWAPAVWVGGEGMKLDIYTAAGAYVGTIEVKSVDITALQLVLASATPTLATATTYTLYRYQAYGLESLGIHHILNNTGTLFGINAANRKLWQSNRYNVASTGLSFKKIVEGISIAYGRGLEGSLDLHVNPMVFAQLMPDFLTVKDAGGSGAPTLANAQFNSKGRIFTDAEQVANLSHGTKSIKFIIDSIEVNLISDNYVKRGYAYGLAQGTWLRVGSTPMTFDLPDSIKGTYFRQLDQYAALELRTYTDEAMFQRRPARNILFYGIDSTL